MTANKVPIENETEPISIMIVRFLVLDRASLLLAVGGHMVHLHKKKILGNALFPRIFGGRNRTRTCDPIDVNDVLYQLSHATLTTIFPNFSGNLS